MKFRKENNTYIVRLEKGDEIVNSLTQFCEENKIYSGLISGIGGTDDFVLKYYDLEKKEYIPKRFADGINYELISLNGNISKLDGKPMIHLHATLGDPEYKVIGGHLDSAVISINGEICINVLDEPLERKFDKDFKVNFWDV